MKVNKVVAVFILVIGTLIFLFSLLISPYKYEWEPLLKQRDDDAIDGLRIFYPILLLVFGTVFLMTGANNKAWVKWCYIAALVVVFYKVLEVFSL